MDRKEYLKYYKKYHYSKTRKIVTFPLLTQDYELLKSRALKYDLTVNKLSKEIILNYLENKEFKLYSKEQLALLKEYFRISRGIANNINQLARSANIGDFIDVNILILSLKKYEEEFKKLVEKLG